ncbi:MAG TPA: OsmC family protein [Acidimicrobiia bacterium]|nr:OsmC family protein [Actinomycetota bacterium]HZQ77336.1 OsmC family protein [Acidimicrobiia bacterium]
MTTAPSPPSIRQAVEAVRERVGDDPARAVVHLRAEGRMEDGARVELRSGAFEFAADEPVSVGGTGTAPNPVQMALAALASCQAITYRYWAEVLGLRLDGVTVTVEADFDTGAFFGFPGAGTPAPSNVRCSVGLDGPEPAGRYEELAAAVDEHCPVLDLFSRPVPVERSVTTP